MGSFIAEIPIATDAGEFLARYSERGLAELKFPGWKSSRTVEVGNVSGSVRAWHRLTVTALKSVLAGRKPEEMPPLDQSTGTDFQRAVWREMSKIAPGKTKSYSDIAAAIGKPKAVRAVGGACGANPLPVLVPCHRVLAANKKIGGFSGGLDWKRELLKRESILI